MKRVLLLGSGYVSGPVVEYLTRDDKTQVTVGELPSAVPYFPYLPPVPPLLPLPPLPSQPSQPACLPACLSACSGSVLLKQAEELAARYPNTIPIMLDAGSQESRLDSLVKDHDLVIR